MHLAELEGGFSGGDGGVDVEPEHAADVRRFEAARRDHALGPSRALLRGLKEYLYISRQLRLHLFEHDSRAEGDGGMDVVAAGVHYASLLRGEGQSRILGERQRVGVGAQRHGLRPFPRGDRRYDRRAVERQFMSDPVTGQRLRDARAGRPLFARKVGIFVQRAPECRYLRQYFRDLFSDIHGPGPLKI
ncbi:hypothetical protein SDC9_171995 [bioreactor metagenome]|uniref:Uncharacterized protein n=1 Tax=bioreactor metagenome TaxID=1076179 RepID=A0A645GKX9_9ZZZZ